MKRQEELREQENGLNTQTKDEDMEGYPLLPCRYSNSQNVFGSDYMKLFGGTGNSSESIFELSFVKDDDNMPANYAVAEFYGNATNIMGFASASSYIGGDVAQEQWKVFANKLDARYYYAVMAGSSTYSICKYAWKNVQIETTGSSAAGAKVETLYSNMYPEKHVQANWIIYRLTDIMLLKAEALTQLIASDDASLSDADKDYLNQAFRLVAVINKRSLCQYPRKDTLDISNFGTKAAIEELVLNERRRELMFEGKRWYDLVRKARRDGKTDYLKSQSCNKYSSNKQLVESKLTRMDAYNNDELKVNKHLHQNEAFGTGLNDSYE